MVTAGPQVAPKSGSDSMRSTRAERPGVGFVMVVVVCMGDETISE